MSDLDHLIGKAKKLARGDDDQEAMSLANKLVEDYPHELKVWSLRAYLHSRNGRHAEAIEDLTHAITVAGVDQNVAHSQTDILTAIVLFFDRGADRFALGEDPLAIDDFTSALELCQSADTKDYQETLHFWRAEAFIRLGRKEEALADLSQVPDGFSFWTSKLRTKADLLDDCGELLGR